MCPSAWRSGGGVTPQRWGSGTARVLRAAARNGVRTLPLPVGVLAGAGVGVGQAGAPAEGAAARGDGGAGGDDVVHEVNGQGLHRAGGANDGVLLDGQAGLTAQAPGARGLHGMGAANGALDVCAGHKLGNGAGKCKVGGEAAVTCGHWHQPARTVNECGHDGGGDLYRFLAGGFQVLGRAAGGGLVGAECAIPDGDILGGVNVGHHKILAYQAGRVSAGK